MLKFIFNKFLPEGSHFRVFLFWLLNHHFFGLMAIIRSLSVNKKLTGTFFPINCLVYPNMKLTLEIDKKVDVQLLGTLHIKPWLSESGSSFIAIRTEAKFLLKNDFTIGQNVQILLSKKSKLIIGGKENNNSSGITADSKVLVADNIEIGAGTIIAWNCFISDANWHSSNSGKNVSPVFIGKNVWLAHGVSVLKGAKVMDNAIIAAKSTVTKKFQQSSVLLAGNPAKIIKENISWSH